MKIKVTQEDINKGVRSDPDKCPVGRALAREGLTFGLYIIGNGVKMLGYTPEDVVKKILKFGQGEKMYPFEFEIEEEKS